MAPLRMQLVAARTDRERGMDDLSDERKTAHDRCRFGQFA